MKKLALPLSLLALGALGLVACGGDDDQTTAASETETSEDSAKQVTQAEYAAVNYDGQSAAQVRAILGEPEFTHTGGQPDWCWYYDVSPEKAPLRERLRDATQICFSDGTVEYTRHGSK